MTNLIGQTLGRYKMLGLLGEGGMGAVYKARDLTLKRVVAIKILHPNFARRMDIRERFLQEAQIAASLKHPGIVEVYDFGQTKDDVLYIVMAFIPGADLSQMLQDMRTLGKWLPLEEAVGLMRLICQAVDYAHRHGVLHRDLKPGNIMLEPEPTDGLPFRPVLTDLGLAKLLEGTHLTQQGTLMGTPAYMSPEQARGEAADARSDVYSLGVLLYELAVGKLPFPAKTITEAIRYHTQEPPPPPRSINPSIPEEFEKIILKALAKDPNERYKDAASLAQELGAISPAVSDITAPPTLLDGAPAPKAVSLMTQYQQSLIAARMPSEFEAVPDLSTGQGVTHIQIRSRDKASRSVVMKTASVTVGRGAENDIVLDDSKVSRKHARIECEGSTYRVTDLESTNGTFLDGIRLLAGVPADLTADKVLRIGDSWLRLLPGEKPVESDVTGAQPVAAKAEGEWIEVQLEHDQLEVEPGGSVMLQITLKNLGEKVDHFIVSVSGIPATWLTDSPPPIQLMPGAAKDLSLSIKPPRAPQSRAVHYPLTVRTSSQNDPRQKIEIRVTLTIAPYSQFNALLQPIKVRAGKPATVVIENQGNLPETFILSWQDRGNELVFTPPRQQLNVTEGQKAMAEFRAEPRQRRWVGGEKSHPVSVQVQPARGEPQTLAGEVTSRALIPAWVPPLTIAILAITCLLFYTFIRPYFEPQIESSLTPEGPFLLSSPVVLAWNIRNAQNVEVLDITGKLISNDSQGQHLFEQGFGQGGELRIIAKNFIGQAEKRIPITITTPEPTKPEIVEFSVSPLNVVLGDSVKIRWHVENAENITIEPLGTRKNIGEEDFTPLEARVYEFILLARNQSKEEKRSIQVVVNVAALPLPNIISFNIDPQHIVKGEATTIRISWETQDAESVSITGVGSVEPPEKGFKDVPAPGINTTYNLMAKNSGGELRSPDITVTVEEPLCQVVNPSGSLNLRSGPGTIYEPPIVALQKDTALTPLEYIPNGFPSGAWLKVQVQSSGIQGWVSAQEKYVACNIDKIRLPAPSTVPPTPTPVPTEVIVVTEPPEPTQIEISQTSGQASAWFGQSPAYKNVGQGQSFLLEETAVIKEIQIYLKVAVGNSGTDQIICDLRNKSMVVIESASIEGFSSGEGWKSFKYNSSLNPGTYIFTCYLHNSYTLEEHHYSIYGNANDNSYLNGSRYVAFGEHPEDGSSWKPEAWDLKFNIYLER